MYNILFLIGRILFGGYFLISGINHFIKYSELSAYVASKKVPLPKAGVFLSGLLLFFGGLGFVLGAYIQIAAILLSVFLFVVSFMMHDFWNVSDKQQRMTQMQMFLKNIALLGAALMFIFNL